MIRLALLGLGNVGGSVLRHLQRHPLQGLRVIAACDLVKPAGPTAALLRNGSVRFTERARELAGLKPDWILEAANPEAVAAETVFFLERGISLIVLSAGGLADAKLYRKAARLCRPGGPRLIVPSGAVGGLDVVRAAAEGRLRRVHLRTTKPAGSLGPKASAVAARGPAVVYRGTAAEAAVLFPRNINVAMALALAGLGPKRTTVEIVAVPGKGENRHEVFIEGDFGRAEIILRNRPSPGNPRTSRLAVYSVLSVLRQLTLGRRSGS
jgi:aspartate dehydrogenase